MIIVQSLMTNLSIDSIAIIGIDTSDDDINFTLAVNIERGFQLQKQFLVQSPTQQHTCSIITSESLLRGRLYALNLLLNSLAIKH
jgi:hypothetical protein